MEPTEQIKPDLRIDEPEKTCVSAPEEEKIVSVDIPVLKELQDLT